MGLLDVFRRGQRAEPEEWRRLGRLEAEVESLGLQWRAYRDELKRLVNRLEKRDARAEERERVASAPPPEPLVDEITQRVHERRSRRHVQGHLSAG